MGDRLPLVPGLNLRRVRLMLRRLALFGLMLFSACLFGYQQLTYATPNADPDQQLTYATNFDQLEHFVIQPIVNEPQPGLPDRFKVVLPVREPLVLNTQQVPAGDWKPPAEFRLSRFSSTSSKYYLRC